MKKYLFAAAISMACAVSAVSAQSDVSAVSALSVMPIASVAVVGSTAAAASIAVPAVLSVGGAIFVVKAVEVSARGTVCLLERVSDGARVSVEIAGRGASNVSLAAGTLVTVSVISAGVVLSAAGEAVAFLPNAVGRALLHHEQITR